MPLGVASITLFRAAVLSIVLTLAVGQNGALLCKIWCEPHEAATNACHHENASTSPRMARNDTCGSVVLNAAPFVREVVRRGVSAADARHAVVVACDRHAAPATGTRFGDESGQPLPLEARPLVIALRI